VDLLLGKGGNSNEGLLERVVNVPRSIREFREIAEGIVANEGISAMFKWSNKLNRVIVFLARMSEC
jgi:hypothetical protein